MHIHCGAELCERRAAAIKLQYSSGGFGWTELLTLQGLSDVVNEWALTKD